MRANEQLTRPGWSGRRRGRLAIAAAAALGLAAAPAAPAAATDDGEDLSKHLVDEVTGYHVAPPGDPLEGLSGPIDWDDFGAGTGIDTRTLPDDMISYARNFFRPADLTSVMLIGFEAEDLDAPLMVSGFAVGIESQGGEAITLPRSDAAHVHYEAFVLASPDLPGDGALSVAAFRAEDDIVVMLVADALRGDTELQRTALDEFVTAQSQFEPPADTAPGDERIGQDAPESDDPAGAAPTSDEPAGDTAAGASQRSDDGGGRSTATRVGLATMWVIGMACLALLVWFVAQARRARPAAAAGWTSSASRSGAWPQANHAAPSGARQPAPPTGPPLPPAARPPLGPPVRRPLPPPPVAPPPIPYGGLRTQRPARPVDAGDGDGDGDGWRLPG